MGGRKSKGQTSLQLSAAVGRKKYILPNQNQPHAALLAQVSQGF